MKNQDKVFSILKDMSIEAKIIEKHFTLVKICRTQIIKKEVWNPRN